MGSNEREKRREEERRKGEETRTTKTGETFFLPLFLQLN